MKAGARLSHSGGVCGRAGSRARAAGCMWGDYIAAAFLHDGRLATMLPLAKRPTRVLDVGMYAPRGGLPIRSGR